MNIPVNQHLANQRKETDELKAEALRLGILIPRELGWWWYDDDVLQSVSSEMWELIKSDHEYLTESGKAGTRRLIRDEQNKLKDEVRKDIAWRRQETLWKFTIAGMIVGWVFGIAGIIISIVALLRASATR